MGASPHILLNRRAGTDELGCRPLAKIAARLGVDQAGMNAQIG